MKIDRHSTASVESVNIGIGTRIEAFVRIRSESVIGAQCIIGEHAVIHDHVVLGDHVIVGPGAYLCGPLCVHDHVSIEAGAVFGSGAVGQTSLETASETVVAKGATIGANSTIAQGLTVGINARVVAGAVITRSVPPHAIVTGNPAEIVGYAESAKAQSLLEPAAKRSGRESGIHGVRLFDLPTVRDMRGNLSVAQVGSSLPFVPRRVFFVYGVPNREIRGEHAHKRLQQFAMCVSGSCSVVVDDGQKREEYVLDTPTQGLLIPPMVWAIQYKYSHDAVLMVLASDEYDADDYIRDYDEFLAMATRE